MKMDVVFNSDGTMEVPVFAPGDHHGTGQPWTIADIDEVIANYNPAVHEAPSVIGHAEQRRSSDPAYGWTESLFRQGDVMWARLKQVPVEFQEWVRAGHWKKRSIEMYTDFQGTGKKYLRAIAWLGAEPPAVKGLPDVEFAEENGPVEVVEFSEPEGREGKLRQIWEQLCHLFGEDDEGNSAGPIENAMAREEALRQFDRIRWLADDELYRIVYDEELSPEEKRTQLRTLFEELATLIGENGNDLIHAFAERSEEMAKTDPNAITMTPEELSTHTQQAVSSALAQFEERLPGIIKTQVDAGVATITQKAHQTGVKAFCERLKEQGLAPIHVDETGLVAFMEGLSASETQVFSEKQGEQTPIQFFQDFLGKLVASAKDNKLIVSFSEVGGDPDPAPEADEAKRELKARAIADFNENRETYEAMGLKVEDMVSVADKLY